MFATGTISLIAPAASTQIRGYATLKDISLRLKSVKNIQKITKSMKMVSAAKFAKAERDLKQARPYGSACTELSEKSDVDIASPSVKKHLIVAVSSDRGLCGAVHTSVVKAVKAMLAEESRESLDTKIVAIGDKSRQQLQRVYASNILLTINDVGKKPPSFVDASTVAKAILNSGYEYDSGEVIFNKFKSVISYTTTKTPFFSTNLLGEGKNFGLYDSLDEETIRCYNEFQLANLIYYGMKESAASEQSARMSAMESATQNATEVIGKLTLLYNRTRQMVITRELIEIISGASALEKKE